MYYVWIICVWFVSLHTRCLPQPLSRSCRLNPYTGWDKNTNHSLYILRHHTHLGKPLIVMAKKDSKAYLRMDAKIMLHRWTMMAGYSTLPLWMRKLETWRKNVNSCISWFLVLMIFTIFKKNNINRSNCYYANENNATADADAFLRIQYSGFVQLCSHFIYSSYVAYIHRSL